MTVLEGRLRFELPSALEAHEPPEARGLTRDGVRLLVTDRATDAITHASFVELPRFLSQGDLLVLNDSGTLPAEVTARRPGEDTGFPFRLSTRLSVETWAVEPRGQTVNPGETLELPGSATARILSPYRESGRLWIAKLELPEMYIRYLLRWGQPIRYPYVPKPWPLDAYQTVYHGELGSAEMASAGRPFTNVMLRTLREAGVRVATLTLHTGVSSLEQHEQPYPEYFAVPSATVQAIGATRADGGRVIAIGTTVVRALESAVDRFGNLTATKGWTELVITPERGVRIVDGLLTGFHEPEASHLSMLAAIAGREHVRMAYDAALAGEYLWHEFGDVHLIL